MPYPYPATREDYLQYVRSFLNETKALSGSAPIVFVLRQRLTLDDAGERVWFRLFVATAHFDFMPLTAQIARLLNWPEYHLNNPDNSFYLVCNTSPEHITPDDLIRELSRAIYGREDGLSYRLID